MSDNLVSQNTREAWVTIAVTNEGGTEYEPNYRLNCPCVVQQWCCLPMKKKNKQ